jgi:hypothetical protein
MRRVIVALTLGASLSVVVRPAAGQTLGDISRAAEAARQEAAGAQRARVYTNKDLPPVDQQGPPLPGLNPPGPAPNSTADQADASAAPPAGTATAAVQDEAYWRDRMRPLRERLDRARALADNAKQRADALMRSADRCFQIGIVCADYTESLRLLDEHKTLLGEVARAERDVVALEEAGRRAGVPPGWLRP